MSNAGEKVKPVIVAGIPCLNTGKHIREIVSRAIKHVDQVIVVDDGSTDNTAKEAEAAGATVIKHPVNRGAGKATQTCFEAARRCGASILVTLDGDGQHNPDLIPEVLAPILKGSADLVIGSRFLGDCSYILAYRKFGIGVITWLCNLGSKVKISDTQSGFRAYGKKPLYALNIMEHDFSFSVELLIKAKKNRFVIGEVYAPCVYNSSSHTANPVIQGLSVAFSVIRLRLKYGLG